MKESDHLCLRILTVLLHHLGNEKVHSLMDYKVLKVNAIQWLINRYTLLH